MPINSINLALTNRCTANCIFCPESRGQRLQSDMTLEIVHKILDEVSSPSFPWQVKTFQVGENGDAPLNKNFLEILRAIKQKMPNAFINMATNFSQMKPELSKILLDERLLHGIQVNIDGHNAESYEAQKILKYENVINNLKAFVKLKSEYPASMELTVHYLTLKDYTDAVRKKFGRDPVRLVGDVPDTGPEQIRESLNSWLPDEVILDRPGCFFWAERALVPPDHDQSRLSCPNYSRVESEAWIAPNGDWYACCLDENQDIVWGNVMKNTLVEIHSGESRVNFLDDLVNRRWKKIGHPCNTVTCCWST